FEFLEVYNYGTVALDISNYTITGLTFTFPAGTTIAPGEYVVVAFDESSYLGNGYQVFDWDFGGLNNNGELLELLTDGGLLVSSVTYDDGSPWPDADASCSSLEILDPLGDPNDPANWQASPTFGGTPGQGSQGLFECKDCGQPGGTLEYYATEIFELMPLDNWTITSGWGVDNFNTISGNGSLSHTGTVAGNDTAYISLINLDPNLGCTNIQFELQTEDWLHGAGNNFKAYVLSNNPDYASPGLEYIAITTSAANEIILEGTVNGVPQTLVNTGYVWEDFESIGFDILFTEDGMMGLKMDISGGFDDLFNYGSLQSYVPDFDTRYFGFTFEHTAGAAGKLLIDNINITQCGLIETYYSVASGSGDQAIWNTDPAVLTGEEVCFTKFKNMVIRNGNTVTIPNSTSVRSITVEDVGGAPIVTLPSDELVVFANYTHNGGTVSNNNGTVKFFGLNHSIGGSSAPVLHNLTSSANFTTTQTSNVSLTGELTIERGTFSSDIHNLILISNATGTARIAEIESGLFSGSVELQRFIPAGADQNYVMLANPLDNQTIANWDDDIITTGFPGSQWPDYPFNNIRYYDETQLGGLNEGWNETSSISMALSDQFGYYVYMQNGSQMVSVNGAIQQGSVFLPLTYTSGDGIANDGWHMVANPYPSEIDFDQLYALSNDIGDTYYIYDVESQAFVTYTVGLGGTASGIIASSQAFWVQATAPGAALQFEESIKSESYVAFERSLEDVPHVVLQIEGLGREHYATIVFDDDYSANLDLGKDALKLAGLSETPMEIATVSEDGHQLTVNRLPFEEGLTEIPVHLNLGAATDYTLRVHSMNGIPQGTCLSLVDMNSGDVYPLQQSEEIEWISTESQNEVAFTLQMATTAVVATTAPTCFDGENGIISVEPTLGSIDLMITDGNGIQILNQTDLLSNITLEDLSSGLYEVQIVANQVACPTFTFEAIVNDGALTSPSIIAETA
ncbi:MAG: lamin tail domain-containing protein, partial [Bacteroidota bacterium]